MVGLRNYAYLVYPKKGGGGKNPPHFPEYVSSAYKRLKIIDI